MDQKMQLLKPLSCIPCSRTKTLMCNEVFFPDFCIPGLFTPGCFVLQRLKFQSCSGVQSSGTLFLVKKGTDLVCGERSKLLMQLFKIEHF
jgi:hypothetical protein